MEKPPMEGRCLCGAVRFTLTPPSNWCAHCHCSMCRLAHGAGYVTWTSVAPEQFRITAGEDQLRRYASSESAERSFCGTCGSSMFFTSSRWPGEIHVAVGCLSSPLDQPPLLHTYFDDRAPWVVVNDDLPRLGGATGTEPL